MLEDVNAIAIESGMLLARLARRADWREAQLCKAIDRMAARNQAIELALAGDSYNAARQDALAESQVIYAADVARAAEQYRLHVRKLLTETDDQ